MRAPVADENGILVVEAPLGSDLYRQALALREAILRRPLGLTLTDEEHADDALRRHFCAVARGAVVGTVSLKPLNSETLQLRQMAVAEDRRGKGSGRFCLPTRKSGREARATVSSCSMPGSAPRASTRASAILAKASRSRRTPCRISE